MSDEVSASVGVAEPGHETAKDTEVEDWIKGAIAADEALHGPIDPDDILNTPKGAPRETWTSQIERRMKERAAGSPLAPDSEP